MKLDAHDKEAEKEATMNFEVKYPSRIISRNTGGNTTYGRALMQGVTTLGIATSLIPSGSHPVQTVVFENLARFRKGQAGRAVCHYVADTGPLVPGGLPAVVTVHGIASRWISGVRNPIQEKIWRTRVSRAITSSQAVVTPSESSAIDIANVFGVPRGDIYVIPHGIEHVVSENTDRKLSEKIAALVSGPFLFYCGNIEPRKNLEALVAAVNSPAVQSMGLKLVVAGKSAWNFEAAMAAIAGSPNVVYLGFVSDSDRDALMSQCTAFVFPSRYEGFGFPVLEALAAGRPVITSSRGSLAEVAGPSWVLEDLTAEAISNGIASALSDSDWLARCNREGQAWARKFSWSRSVSRHVDVYRKVVAG